MPLSRLPLHMAEKVADVATLGSGGLAGMAWVSNAEPVITLTAGVVAIVAGVLAAWFHYERALDMRSKRLADELKKVAAHRKAAAEAAAAALEDHVAKRSEN